jgi:site-specific DNA recombinase
MTTNQTQTQKPWAVYTRISRDPTDTSPSPDTQATNCRTALAQRGLTAHEPPFEDRDISASEVGHAKQERPAFDDMMRQVKAGEFAGVCVFKLDRFTRSNRDSVHLLDLNDAGAAFLSVTEPFFDITTPMGQGMVALFVGQGAQESYATSIRMRAAFKTSAEAGAVHGGGHRSFGYSWTLRANKFTPGYLTVVPAEAKIIKRMVKMLTAGKSLRAVATWLNDSGVPTTTGSVWTHQSVKQTLQNPKLIGMRTYKGALIPSTEIPAILTEQERNAALQAIDHGNGYRSAPERKANQYLLSGKGQLIFCSSCHSPMYPFHAGNSSQVTRYQCRPEGQKCGRSIIIRAADQTVYGQAVDYASQHGITDASTDDNEAQLATVTAAKKQCLTDLAQIQSAKWATQDADIRASYDAAFTTRTADLAVIKAEEMTLETKLSKPRGFARWGAEAWQSKDMAIRREWLRLYVERVDIDASVSRSDIAGRIHITFKMGPYTPTAEDDEGVRVWNAIQPS